MQRIRTFRLRFFYVGCGLMRLDLRIRTGFVGSDLYIVNQCVHRDLRIVRHFMSSHPGVVNSRIRLDTETIIL